MDAHPAQSLPKDTNVLDVVMYLASLASNPREIDPIMDTVRVVTAQPSFQRTPSPQDAQRLEGVWSQLEEYLVAQEKVRAFTREDLRQRIHDRFGGSLAKRAKKLLAGLLLATPLCAFAILIPQPAGLPKDIADAFAPLIFIAVVITWLYITAALLFSMGLSGFQQQVKRAYAAICAGTVLVGMGVLQLPAIVSLGWLDTAFFTAGGFMVLHVLSATVLFFGACLFAHRLGKTGIWRVAVVMLLTTAAVAAIGGLLTAGDSFDATPMGRLWAGVLCAMNAGIVLHLKRTSTPVYGKALGWFFAALLMGAITQAVGLVMWLVGEGTSPVILVPYFVMAPLYVAAGYAFNKIGEY